jgi:hypothetical protein
MTLSTMNMTSWLSVMITMVLLAAIAYYEYHTVALGQPLLAYDVATAAFNWGLGSIYASLELVH